MISVIVPCYNQGEYLSETLQSVLSQTYTNWECVIVNDGSTDDTEDVAMQWVKEDGRFRYIKKKNGGLSSARNEGLNVINGEYVQFLDSDDLIDKEKFKLSIEAIVEKKGTLVISDFLVLDEFSKKQRPSWWSDLKKIDFSFDSILLEWDISFTIPIHCGLFPRIYFEQFRFDETLGAKEDWLMWLTIFKIFCPKVHFINKTLATYRWGPFGMTKKYDFMHENIKKAFVKVYTEFVEEKNKDAYFKKINEIWYKQLQYSEIRNQNMLNSRVYKFSAEVARPVRYIREILSRWKPKK
jgi:glycosyltransferase involved in cell wall biosynthesis